MKRARQRTHTRRDFEGLRAQTPGEATQIDALKARGFEHASMNTSAWEIRSVHLASMQVSAFHGLDGFQRHHSSEL